MEWRKSSFSNGNGDNNCVEVARFQNTIFIRDSKPFPNSQIMYFTLSEWMAFVRGVKNGEFDVAD